MGNVNRNTGIVLGRSIEKWIGVAVVTCALVLGIFLTTLPILAPTARAQGQDMVTVPIRDFFFDPTAITVEPGTTVMWVNEGIAPHTVTSEDGQFDSETLMPGDSFAVDFSGQGTLTYHCEIHPSMTGSVTVGESGGETAPTDESSMPAAPVDDGTMNMSMGSGY